MECSRSTGILWGLRDSKHQYSCPLRLHRWAGAPCRFSGLPGWSLLRDHRYIPQTHFRPKQTEQAGCTGHWYMQLASPPRATWARKARAPCNWGQPASSLLCVPDLSPKPIWHRRMGASWIHRALLSTPGRPACSRSGLVGMPQARAQLWPSWATKTILHIQHTQRALPHKDTFSRQRGICLTHINKHRKSNEWGDWRIAL